MTDEITPIQETPQTEAPQEPIPAPEPTPEPQTAQFPPNEPLGSEPVQASSEAKLEPAEEPEILEAETPEPKSETQSSAPTEASLPSVPVVVPKTNSLREFLNKAQFAIQTRKKKKLEKIMSLFAKRTSITNDEVEKLLHVSDATATRYLTILKKENKIKQIGKTGKGVSYSKM